MDIRLIACRVIKLVLILCLFFFNFFMQATNQQKLMGLVVFHRHGARLPAVEDYYSKWANGLNRGELTDIGIAQLNELGQALRKRYIEKYKLLPAKYDGRSFKVRMAKLSRCMLSLLSLINGMYPEVYNHISQTRHTLINPHLPIRFSTDAQINQSDILFRAQSQKTCRLLEHITQKRRREKKFKIIFEFFKAHPVMNQILEKLEVYRIEQEGNPVHVDGMYFLKEIYDSYMCNKIEGNPVPDWNNLEIKFLQFNYEVFFYSYLGFRSQRKVSTSKFFQEVHKFFKNRIANPDNPQKAFIFSGTKTNISMILLSLLTESQIKQLGSEKIPSLSSTLYFELWEHDYPINEQKKDRYYFKIIFNTRELEINSCSDKLRCTWKEFSILLKTRIKPNIQDFCDLGYLL